MTLRIGFHGAGFISVAHRWLLAHSGVAHELVAIHDPDPARAAASPTAPERPRSASPTSPRSSTSCSSARGRRSTRALVADAAAAGRAVFCEKPLAIDADQADG